MIKDFIDVKGSWRQRMFIYSMTIFLCLLFMWVLQFVLDDIRNMQTPQWAEIEKTYLSQEIVKKQQLLQEQIDEKNITINQLNQQRTQLKESTQNAQVSLKQLDEQQKMSLHKGQDGILSENEVQFKNNNMALFQKNQGEDQKLAQLIINLTAQQQQLTAQLRKNNTILDKQREPAKKSYNEAASKQNFIEATLQILFLLLALLVSVYLLLKYQKTIYKMPLLAFFAAALYKIVCVLHDYFPTEYFKYILIVVLIAVVAKILMYLIKNATSVKPEVLLKRYRDAYSFFVCPTCEFPIRRGPMKYLYWTRRSLPKVTLGLSDEFQKPIEEVYTCPVCSTELFSECKNCKKICYSLLPTCQVCGDSK